MLNISEDFVSKQLNSQTFRSFSEVLDPKAARSMGSWLLGILAGFIIVLFMPWTQNIRARGQVTTLSPAERPQTIHSTIAGRIEHWYVNEGDTVFTGDTIVHLSEIKDDYFDPELLNRTDNQIEAKEGAIVAYREKAEALARQIEALKKAMQLKVAEANNKVRQSQLKIVSDSIDLQAIEIEYSIAQTQFARWDTLYKQGIKSRTDWEEKRNKLQSTMAKRVAQQNKLDVSRAELANALIVRDNVRNEYTEKISKAQSDRQSALSAGFDAEAEVAKMRIYRSNLGRRVDFRYITAPQNGIINKALRPGIGETVKEGEAIVSVVGLNLNLATEIFVRPVDLPLIHRGEHVRIEFDGWPSIVFSGWPNASFGTFGGRVFAIENSISSSGRYRILVAPDPDDEPWPDALRPGSGVNAFALLEDVPLWYELWRQLNGFPPNYYQPMPETEKGGQAKK